MKAGQSPKVSCCCFFLLRGALKVNNKVYVTYASGLGLELLCFVYLLFLL